MLVEHPRGGHDEYATAVALSAVACRQAGTSTLTAREILSIGEEEEDREVSVYGRAYRSRVLF